MPTETTNSLAHASSSYLRSAMHQPIRWYQWGEEAFAAAQRENKPILLDIGAVWCHWCHVMDRESYDEPEIARIVNDNFIAMKVDRDERPDIDSRYQSAVQAMTGQGGWPLTVFLTPEGKPFYGGTYFPPDDHFGRPGFKRVLAAIADAFRGKREEVAQQAEIVLNAIGQAESFAGRGGSVPPNIVRAVVASALKIFDPDNGGFGSAPKFPHPSTMDLIIHVYSRSGDERLKEVITATLEHMARGGVYDQLAGGFHRYSTDERWIVPHFEKMSYDNSELLKNYVHAYQATGNTLFAAIAGDIIRWMDAWLSDRGEGGFYASQDADINLDDDGDYFTWTLDEARAVLSEDELQVAQLYYDINELGEMHHNSAKNVLYVRAAIEEIAVRTGMNRERVSSLLDAAKEKLYAARLKRRTPFVDKTVYVGWNALCISAYLEAARVLSLEDARHFALRSLDRILAQACKGDGGLKHVIAYADPQGAHRDLPGMLDDYAFTALACLDAYEATADLSYFNFARNIVNAMMARFHDETSGGFLDAENKGALGALTARRKPFQDSPTPAGNSAAAIALFRMHAYTNEEQYRDKAEETLEVFGGMAEQYGMFAATYALAAVWSLEGHTQVVVVGSDQRARELYAAAVAPFAVNKAVLKINDSAAAPQNLPPAIAETVPSLPAVKEGKSVAVICANFICQAPISDPDELAKALHDALVAKAA